MRSIGGLVVAALFLVAFDGGGKQGAILKAIGDGDAVALERLLADKPRLDFFDDYGNSPIALAVSPCRPVMVAMLASHGADVNAPDRQIGIPPLAFSIMADGECVGALLKAGADVNREDGLHLTPLGHAVHKGDMTLVATLVKAGADLKRKQAGAELATFARTDALKSLLAACARSAAECDPAAVAGPIAPTPEALWWKKGDAACPAKAKLERKGDIVRCTCGGGTHGPYSELYPGTDKPLITGTFRLHKKNGTFTTFAESGATVKVEQFVDDDLVKTDVRSTQDVPPVLPGDFLGSGELDRMRAACRP